MKSRNALPVLFAAVALVAAGIAVAAPGGSGGRNGGGGSSDSIWILGTAGGVPVSAMQYGSSFSAGFSSKASNPWGFAQCWANSTTRLASPTTGVIWSEYASLQPDGTLGSFVLTDPIQEEWLGGGADCTLSLVAFQGSQLKTLATTNFTVAG
jgi:hypothetical protein